MGTVIRLPEAADIDGIIASTVRALAASRHETIEQLASNTGIAKSSLYRKLDAVTGFKASEVARLAEYFGCSVADLYDGLGGRLTPAPAANISSGCSSNDIPKTSGLRLISGATPLVARSARRAA